MNQQLIVAHPCAVEVIGQHGDGKRLDHYLFLDKDKNPVGERALEATLVPTSRPWYKLAMESTGVVVTGASAEEDGWQPMSWPAIDGDTARGSVALPDRSLLPRTTTAPSRTQQGAL